MPPQEKQEKGGGDAPDPYREVPPEQDGGIFRAGSVPINQPPPGIPEAPPPLGREAFSLSPLRTYKSDAAEAVKEKRASVSSLVTAEQARRESGGGSATQAPEESFVLGFRTKTGAFLALFAGVAFSLGIGLVSFLLLWKEREPEITAEAQALVFVNKEIKIDARNLDRAVLETKVKEALGTKGLLLNDLVAITFVRERTDPKTGKTVEEIVGIEEILSRLANEVPSELLRALGEEYLYGIHALGENIPFLIVRVRSYENAFSGVFEWAKTITHDVAVLFNITRFPPPEIHEFDDILIRNRDVGVLYDEAKVPIIYYSFVDRETLIFTTDRTTFEELLNRLATPKRTVR